jgi:hypothetical protein
VKKSTVSVVALAYAKLLLAPLGPANGEYTFSGAKLLIQLTAGISF